MNFPRPFEGVDPATRRLRLFLLGATFLGMLCCLPLWLNARAYPLVPIIPGFLQLPPPMDKFLLAITLLSLVSACWFYRSGVSFFLAATLWLYCGDQNRGQPWMYLYWVMLLLSLGRGDRGWAAMRVAISASYVWAGLQKLNPTFFKAIPAWFVQPVQQWGVPDFLIEMMRLAVAGAPFVEIAIGVGVWISRVRRGALALVILLHGVSLVFLGPLGHNVNLVVWPWNLAMIALMRQLFPAGEGGASFPVAWQALRQAHGAVAVLALFCLLPVLSFWGRWDSYFSFALYSANTARADIYLSESLRDRLAPEMRRFVEPVENFDPSFQKPFVFSHLKWAVAELGVPPIAEPHAFVVVFQAFSHRARDEQDCHMIVATRTSRTLLLVPGANSPKMIE